MSQTGAARLLAWPGNLVHPGGATPN